MEPVVRISQNFYMLNSKFRGRRLLALLLLTVLLQMPVMAKTVYYDNGSTNWSKVCVHFWGGALSTDWPGLPDKHGGDSRYDAYSIGIYQGQVYKAVIPDDATGVIFNGGSDSSQTPNLIPVDGHVYVKGNDSASSDKGHIDDYVIGGGDDTETTEYTIYFENSADWSAVAAWVFDGSHNYSGGSWPGRQLTTDINNFRLYPYAFTAPKSGNGLKCIFNDNTSTDNTRKTVEYDVKNGWVYNAAGAVCHINEYTGPDQSPEYWTEPSVPSLNDEVTLWFNRTKGDGALKNEDNIYLYSGLRKNGDTEWRGAPAWDMSDSELAKCKLSRSAENRDLFYITLSPSLSDFYGVYDDVDQLAFIFRDKTGKVKQDSGENDGNHFINLKQLPPDPSKAPLGAFQSISEDNGVFTVAAAKGSMQLTLMAPDVIKVFTLPSGAQKTSERESISVCLEPQQVSYTTTDADDYYEINMTEGGAVRIAKASCLLSYYDAGGELLLEESAGLVNSSTGSSVTFLGMNDIAFYGGGYNGNYVNQNGKTMEMNNRQTGGWEQGWSAPHNICIPYFVSTSGYGVLFDDHYQHARICPSSTGSTYQSNTKDPIAYYFVGGGDMESAMQNYVLLTGRQEMPPYWALGYISSKFSFATKDEATNVITKTRELNIPIDGIVFDIHWQGGKKGAYGMGRLDWAADGSYGNGSEMIQGFLRDYKVHSVAITEPFFSTDDVAKSNYDMLKSENWLTGGSPVDMSWMSPGGNCGLIDVTIPEAMAWLGEKHVEHARKGMSGWWLDLGEPEKQENNGNLTYKGGSAAQVLNEYGLRWLAGVYNSMKAAFPERRQFIMPRAGTAGMQRYSAFPWTGDILRSDGGLKAQVPALVSASMSGVGYLGSDIGGFTANGANPDLYNRWVQLGVFYPMMRTHSANNPEPWNGAGSNQELVKKFIRMRYQYLPYTYTMAYQNSYLGKPMARPVNFYDADKSRLADCNDEYLWGRDVLVAPVLSGGATSRSISFPDGRWLDMNDYKVYGGGTSVTYDAPKDRLPFFLREGAFLPSFADTEYLNTEEIDTSLLTVDYFVNNTSTPMESLYYEDDHLTPDPVGDGKYLLTHFIGYSDKGNHVIFVEREGSGFEEMPEKHHVVFRIHQHNFNENSGSVIGFNYGDSVSGSPAMAAALVDRADSYDVIPASESLEELNSQSVERGYYKGNDGILYVKMPLESAMNTAIEMGTPGLLTGLAATEVVERMTLSYAHGHISYSAPQGTVNLRLDVYNATGAKVASFSSLTADGNVAQIGLPLSPGVYVAVLSGADADGVTVSRKAKVMAK